MARAERAERDLALAYEALKHAQAEVQELRLAMDLLTGRGPVSRG